MLDGLRRELDEIKSVLAARALARAQVKYSPSQPRVPSGRTGGGQWTSGSGGRPRVIIDTTDLGNEGEAGDGAFDGGEDFLGDGADSNPGFDGSADNFETDDSNVPSNVSRPASGRPVVRINTTDWDNVEEKPNRPYDTRLASNDDKPRLGQNSRVAIVIEIGRRLVRAFRSENGLFDLFNHTTGTVAHAKIDERDIFGSNSTSPTYTSQDREAADRMRDVLTQKYPDVMKTDNVGHKPNDALYHAETNVLLRSAKETGGTLSGRSIEIYVDRRMCNSCEKVVPFVGLELGNPEIVIVDPQRVFTMKNGAIISRRPR